MRAAGLIALALTLSWTLPAAAADPAAAQRLSVPCGLNEHVWRSHRASQRLKLQRDLARLKAAVTARLAETPADAPDRAALERLLHAINTRRPPAIRAALHAL
jgi:hypothetical protein